MTIIKQKIRRLAEVKIPGKKTRGFSLIEVLVVITLFSIIMAPIMGYFAYTVNAQRYALASEQLLDQSGYAIDYMTRMIRMAKKSSIAGDEGCVPIGSSYALSGGGQAIYFIVSLNGVRTCQTFSFSAGSGKIDSFNFNLANPTQIVYGSLTANSIKITDLIFQKVGDSTGNQPRVTLRLEGQAAASIKPVPPNVRLQATVSQRDLNISP